MSCLGCSRDATNASRPAVSTIVRFHRASLRLAKKLGHDGMAEDLRIAIARLSGRGA